VKIMLAIIILGALCTTLPAALFAGSKQDAAAIVDRMLEQYSVPVEREKVYGAVTEALEAGVPNEEVSLFMSALAQTERPFDEIGGYLHTIGELHQSGIHSELVLNTILEGVAKGIPGETIQGSISSYKEKLVFCRDVALLHISRKRSHSSRVDLLTDALFITMNVGFDRERIASMSRVIQRNNKSAFYFIKTLEVMIELKNLNLPNEQIIDLLSASIALGSSLNDMGNIPSWYQAGLNRGLGPDEIYASLLQRLERGESHTGSAQRTQGAGGATSGGTSSGPVTGSGGAPGGSPGSGKGRRNGDGQNQ